MDLRVRNCLLELQQIEAIQFGTFTLKSGQSSPFYIDLRTIISYPALFKQITELMWERIQTISFERICPVPYAAVPLAAAICLNHHTPMLFRRKESKAHGTKKMIEGHFEKGNHCLVVDDLITSGESFLETIEPLERSGLVIKDLLVFIDREQGGKQALQDKGYTLHSVVSVTEMFSVLKGKKQ